MNFTKKKKFYHFPNQHMKILLGGFKAMLEKEGVFKPAAVNDVLFKDRNGKVFRVVNLATLKSLLLRAQCSTTETFVKQLFLF